jgi:SAM-dependent methyltransferase
MNCIVCGNKEGKLFTAREMMFGYKDTFEYFECRSCGCVQISETPKDMAKYYPEGYYSLSLSQQLRDLHKNPLKKFLVAKKVVFEVFDKGVIGRIMCRFYPINASLVALRRARTNTKVKVLDVGCGTGSLLYQLKIAGFTDLTGVDPFIKQDIVYSPNFTIFKVTIHDMDGSFDLIIFNDSLEHIPDQLETLRSVAKLLKNEGTCVISMPTVSSYAWKHYGANWVQLDPPRHLFIHSICSLKLLLEKASLKLTDAVYNSAEFQFWGSEQYVRDIPLKSSKSYSVNPKESMFSKEEMKRFRDRTRELNEKRQGDQAIFYVEKP